MNSLTEMNARHAARKREMLSGFAQDLCSFIAVAAFVAFVAAVL